MLGETRQRMLDDELTFFEEERSEWLEQYKGQYALIKGRKLFGTFVSSAKAYDTGLGRFGREPFLVVPSEPQQ
ncbi:hypothetical protein MYX82_12625 [Acidobacteria bacterium AH-259-D05]|nr:hypothetical protein [Acidobacteria bacterium AH-259-D05]